MRLLFRATDASYRAAIVEETANGRVPLAFVTFGTVRGQGWGFLHPWAQLALFPLKGSPGGIYSHERGHDRFALVRLWPSWSQRAHRNHEHAITGRYWHGLAWRRSWGWRPRWVVLDPDIVTDDPHQAPFRDLD